MTKSLYLKYRPQTFEDVYGQNIIKKILINSLKQNKLNHAYLFYGIRGTGKTTLARLFAKAINCEKHHDGNICNECNSCKEINNSSSLNVIEIDAATHNSVEDIRDLVEKASYLTQQDKYKIYIIDEVHMLSKSAFNALLKTLEEPPSHTIFLLATTEINKIPETILSRTIVLNLENLSSKEIISNLESILKQENSIYDVKALEYVAEASQGSMRDAISLLTNIILYSNNISVQDTVKVLGIFEKSVIDDILLGKKDQSMLYTDKNLNIKKILHLLISEVTYLVENHIASPKFELNTLLSALINLATFTKDETLYYSILPSIFIDNLTIKNVLVNNVSYETIKENKLEINKKVNNQLENIEKEVIVDESANSTEKIEKNNKEEDKLSYEEKDLVKDITIVSESAESVNATIEPVITVTKELQQKNEEVSKKTITDYVTIDYYKELLFTSDTKVLSQDKIKWEDVKNFANNENKFYKYAKILVNARLLASSKLGLIIGFEDKIAVEEYKKISIDAELFEFINIILGKSDILLPVHPENWKKLIKSVNSSYELKHIKKVNSSIFMEKTQTEVIDLEKELFGDKISYE